MSSNGAIQLTAEQRARIEENRRQALERLKARKEQNSSNQQKVLPKVTSSNRVNPYLKPPVNKFQSNQSTYTRPQTTTSNPQPLSVVNKPVPVTPKKAVNCTFELVNEDRFMVKTNGYDEKVIQEFKKIPSKIYHGASRNWSFNYSHYNELAKALEALGNHVTVTKVPEFVIKNMMQTTELPDESCLSQIEQKLVSSLIDFQRTGICFGISKKGRCMIADDMGLGKSRQAIGIADFYRDDWPLLIITNASTRQFWSTEIEKLIPRLTFNDVHIIQGTKDYFDRAKVVVCSYSNLQGCIDDLLRVRFGVIIFDESHNLKNLKAKQTVNAEKISKTASRIIMLSGTPALSRPVELYTQLKFLDPSFATYTQFTARYCNGMQTKFGWTANGSSNLEELNILLRKKFMIRRIKSDVFLELGAKNRELVMLEKYEYTENVESQMDEFRSEMQEADKNNRDTEEILIKWYQSTSQVKAYGCCTFVKKYLEENDCKILVFAHHGYMMNALCAELEKNDYSFIKIDGTVRGDVRAQRVEAFQNDPHIRVAVLSIRACNAGITLTAASTIIFCEFDWNPSTIVQAEGRAHRIGQESQVRVYFLLAPRTVDDYIWQLLQNKQRKLGQAGLVDNVENFAANVKISKFNVQQKLFESSSSSDKKPPVQNEKKTDYFSDDDMDDAEFLKLVENLP